MLSRRLYAAEVTSFSCLATANNNLQEYCDQHVCSVERLGLRLHMYAEDCQVYLNTSVEDVPLAVNKFAACVADMIGIKGTVDFNEYQFPVR